MEENDTLDLINRSLSSVRQNAWSKSSVSIQIIPEATWGCISIGQTYRNCSTMSILHFDKYSHIVCNKNYFNLHRPSIWEWEFTAYYTGFKNVDP